MIGRFVKKSLGAAIVTMAVISLATGQAPPQKKVKDQAEFDLFTEVTKTTDPAKRLALLDTWKSKYADTEFKQERLQFYLTTYQGLNRADKMAETAKELLALDPKDVTALYWMTLLTETLPPTPDNLSTGEKAAQGLLAAQKPAAVTEQDWKNLKTEVIGHKVLGFIADKRKDFPTSEKEYAKALELNPNFAQVSYALGMVIYQQKKPERQPEVLFHWARAASLTGVGEFPAADRQKIDAFFVKAYNTYHGSQDGLKELRAAALAAPLPPADLKIRSKVEIDAENQEKFAKENPQLALWMNIKNQLTAADGQQYFDNSMKGAAVPKLRGKVISQKPATRPKEVVVAIEKPDVGEITLVLPAPLAAKAEPGTEIEFEGVPSAFTKEPFMVTFDVEGKDKITGWPAAAAAGKKTASKKK